MTRKSQNGSPDIPEGFFINQTSDFLVRTRNRSSDVESYELTRELVRRASDEGEFSFLLPLLKSRSLSRKAFGSFLIGEISDKTGLVWPALRKQITLWADDLVHGFRFRFVDFIINSEFYDVEIAGGMQKCIDDDSNYVRQNSIFWLCTIKPNRYSDFRVYCSKTRDTGGEYSRLNRAFSIADLIRSGKNVSYLIENVKFEEYETFEDLKRKEGLIAKQIQKW
jgi:hypothetical protein